MKTCLFLTRVIRFVAFALALLFHIMCVVCEKEIGLLTNPPVQAIIMGISILIALVWVIADSVLSALIELIKKDLKDSRSENEDIKVL